MKNLLLTFFLGFGLIVAAPSAGSWAAIDEGPGTKEVSAEEHALRAAAEQGDANAQYALGHALVRPIPPHMGPVKEGEEAVVWLEKGPPSPPAKEPQ